uniref:Glucosamine 6-phosphate N-acetyltransferase n=1 Tax=Panstrongylus megistus TaxID=65343 RepID=A0A069DQ84_9HEMI
MTKEIEELYDRSLIETLDFSSVQSSYNPKINIENPGNDLKIRPLRINDYEAGYMQLLSQLTEVGEYDKEKFIETFKLMKQHKGMYYIIVIEDVASGQVIGSGTLFIEQKFIHNCALRGRLEDIVVSNEYRGKQLGKLIVHTLTLLSKHLNCYKVTLDCKDSNRPFYEGLGYKKEESNSNFMQIRFH